MKITIYKQGGNLSGGYTMPGMTLTGPLLVTVTPTAGNHVVNKQYVDTAATSLNAGNVSSGTLPATYLPAYTGDITKLEGNNNINLNETGVSPGEYTKVTVNKKGFITAGSVISDTDLPNLSWNKITLNRPNTLSGYGITDALSVGGTITGQLTLAGAPVGASDAATKQYVDGAGTSGGGGLVSGDIINRLVPATPDGYLKCNGAVLNKTTYANLYAVVGDAFSISVPAGNGKPWQQQYAFNTQQSTDITGWTTGTSLPATVYASQAIVTKNRVYLLGGHNGSGYSSTVYTAPINADGTLGTWTTGTSLPDTVYHSQAIVTKNRVYLLGGAVNGFESSTVYTAPINADGTLGTWTTGTSLPGTVYHSHAIVTKNRVYLLGGAVNGSGSSTVYTAPINADGTLGTWTTGTSLPGTVYDSQAIVTSNRVYLLGGAVNGSYSSTVYTAPINTDGTLGTWTTGTSLPDTVYVSQPIVTKNRVYLLGGAVNGSGSSTVYTAPINTDGTLGTWTTGTSLPDTVYDSQPIVTKNRVYLLGGYVNGSVSSTVYTAPFTGGTNDYSPYYNGASTVTDPNSFVLPDYTSLEEPGYYFFIKT